MTIPVKGWTVDVDNFRTKVRNFFDHNSVGNSNIFFPLTIDGALIRGWELTLRSPRIGSGPRFTWRTPIRSLREWEASVAV